MTDPQIPHQFVHNNNYFPQNFQHNSIEINNIYDRNNDYYDYSKENPQYQKNIRSRENKRETQYIYGSPKKSHETRKVKNKIQQNQTFFENTNFTLESPLPQGSNPYNPQMLQIPSFYPQIRGINPSEGGNSYQNGSSNYNEEEDEMFDWSKVSKSKTFSKKEVETPKNNAFEDQGKKPRKGKLLREKFKRNEYKSHHELGKETKLVKIKSGEKEERQFESKANKKSIYYLLMF